MGNPYLYFLVFLKHCSCELFQLKTLNYPGNGADIEKEQIRRNVCGCGSIGSE
jgi:hypothetical protein